MMRPHRAPSILRWTPTNKLHHRQHVISRSSLTFTRTLSVPPASRFEPNRERWHRYEDPTEEIRKVSVRNPLNYVEIERQKFRRDQILWKRVYFLTALGIFVFAIRKWIDFHHEEDPERAEMKRRISEHGKGGDRLDTHPRDAAALAKGNERVVVQTKPGNPEIKVDEDGRELVDTGTSSIPHFPRFIRLPSSDPDPSATADPSTSPTASPFSNEEEYMLLGLGIRKVSFLRVQVYVLGLYVRTTDLEHLQAAFVKHVNPLGSSLIPGEKEQLRAQLLAQDASSLELWDKVLRETKVRSAVRIVPTRGTDFNHLRDGWVTGITSRTQELAKKAKEVAAQAAEAAGVPEAAPRTDEFTDESFGAAMQEFKTLLSGRGKAPKGSTVLLTRDERGGMTLLYEAEVKPLADGSAPPAPETQVMGKLKDERISRQVWLGYLGGKNVSSEDARKSIVDGVMELVARPVGTVSVQVT